MPALIALALSVGVLAVLDTWLFTSGSLPVANLQVWISFISWGCHFVCGGKAKGSLTATACMVWGAVVGMVAVILAGGAFAGLGGLAVPVAVGLGAALIVLTSKIPYLEVVPVGFFGFAAIAAVIVLAGVAPTAAILPVAISVVIGVIFGFVSEIVANALTKQGETDAEHTADPGHA